MKVYYSIIFTVTDDCVLIEVPDFKILTQGNSLNDAIKMAEDAISLNISSMKAHGENIPLGDKFKGISKDFIEDYIKKEGTFSKNGFNIPFQMMFDI